MDSRNSIFDFFLKIKLKNSINERSGKIFWGKFSRWNQTWTQKLFPGRRKWWKDAKKIHFFWSQFKTYYDVVKNQLKQLNEALKSLLRLRKICCTCEEGFLKSFQCQTLIQRRNLPPKIFIMSYFENLSRKSGIHGIIASVLRGKKLILSSDSNSAWKLAPKNLF